MVFEKISDRICSIVAERGLSKYEFAAQCHNISQSTVYNAMSGERSMKVETLVYICEALGITLKQFFDWEDNDDYLLSLDEKTVVESMRQMDEKKRQRLMGYASSLNENND
ncbi:MAG: helix-turn-helix domain-containing protein [Lachnospiraceae bacterium]|nr:helix-turn-helix domain-containing protein [Lachnospiraceae bacterium]